MCWIQLNEAWIKYSINWSRMNIYKIMIFHWIECLALWAFIVGNISIAKTLYQAHYKWMEKVCMCLNWIFDIAKTIRLNIFSRILKMNLTFAIKKKHAHQHQHSWSPKENIILLWIELSAQIALVAGRVYLKVARKLISIRQKCGCNRKEYGC